MAEYVFPEGDNSSPRRITFEASREMSDYMNSSCPTCFSLVLNKNMDKHVEWHSKVQEVLNLDGIE